MNLKVNVEASFGSDQKSRFLDKLAVLGEVKRDASRVDALSVNRLCDLRNGNVFLALVETVGGNVECYAGIKVKGSYKQANNALVVGGDYVVCGAQHDFSFGPLMIGIPWSADVFPLGIRFHGREIARMLEVGGNA